MALNILVIDDSLTVHDVFTKTFRLAHIPVSEIFHAYNGLEGLAILKEKWIDIVFADLHMPQMGGVELIQHMKYDKLLDNIPVVVVSAEGNQNIISALREEGIRGFIRKPFTPEEIREIIHEILGVSYA